MDQLIKFEYAQPEHRNLPCSSGGKIFSVSLLRKFYEILSLDDLNFCIVRSKFCVRAQHHILRRTLYWVYFCIMKGKREMPVGWQAREEPRYRIVRNMPSEFVENGAMVPYEYFAMKKPDVTPPFATNFGDQYLEGELDTREILLPPARPANHYDIVRFFTRNNWITCQNRSKRKLSKY